MQAQGAEIKQLISEVTQDIKFEQHRLVLVQGYGLFIQAIQRFQTAMNLQDINRRNADIDAVRGMLSEALAVYTNPHLLAETCTAGQLRRLECAWAIEQAIIASYQAQNEVVAVSDRLSHLQQKIRQDSLDLIDRCETEQELDFLFPEITRIHSHDLAVLESWQNHTDWLQTLSPDERQMLASDLATTDYLGMNQELAVATEPEEQLLYDNLKSKSHYLSLRDQLKFIVKSDLRQPHESFISQQAAIAGYKALVPSNLQQASNLTVANLYWYFKTKN